jgi:hypothetical protein
LPKRSRMLFQCSATHISARTARLGWARRCDVPSGSTPHRGASCGRPRQGVPPDLDSAESSARGGAFRGDRGCGNETTVRDSQSPKSGSGADLRFGAFCGITKGRHFSDIFSKYSFSFAKSTSKHAVLTPFAAFRLTTTRNGPAAPLSEATSASGTLRRFSAP